MCKVYNQVGSLTAIKTKLYNHGIRDFQSLNDLISFLNNFAATRQKVISSSANQITQEKEILKKEIALLEDFIETCRSEHTVKLLLELEELKEQLGILRSSQSNLFDRINSYLKGNSIQSKIRRIETNFDAEVTNAMRRHTDLFAEKRRRLDYVQNNFERAVKENSYAQLRELARRKSIVDELAPYIYGAIGEHKVSNELGQLPDDFILINDFSCSFQPPIYNKQKDDYIQSVQIDHLLVGPSGVFLIETKNWSEQSMNNLNLRSPVEQIKRSSFALYITLNGGQASSLLHHHWGERKIPIKNLIVLINQKPREEFQYVKILTLKELCSYVQYFKPIFSPQETQSIANYMLRLSGNSY